MHQLENLQLKKLSSISLKLREIMAKCWDFRPKERPDFVALYQNINSILSIESNLPQNLPPTATGYLVVGQKSENSYVVVGK